MFDKNSDKLKSQIDDLKKDYKNIISWNNEKKIKLLDERIEQLESFDYSKLDESPHGFGEEAFTNVFVASADKAMATPTKALIAGFLGGFFISIGYIACLYALRGIEGAGLRSLVFGAVFPVSILLITFIGGGLFTSNAIGFLPVSLGNVPLKNYLRSLFIVLFGNFLGCFLGAVIIFVAEIMPNYDHYFSAFSEETQKWDLDPSTYNNTFGGNVINLFDHKAGSFGMCINSEIKIGAVSDHTKTFFSNLASGIFCNILVAATLWLTYSTKNAAAIILLLACDIFAFAISGFSHVVANSFILFMGMLMTGMEVIDSSGTYLSITMMAVLLFFVYNLVPAMIGNLLGGGIMLPFMAYGLYGARVRLMSKKMKLEFYISVKEKIQSYEEDYKESVKKYGEDNPLIILYKQLKQARREYIDSYSLSKTLVASSSENLHALQNEYKLVVEKLKQSGLYSKYKKAMLENRKKLKKEMRQQIKDIKFENKEGEINNTNKDN